MKANDYCRIVYKLLAESIPHQTKLETSPNESIPHCVSQPLKNHPFVVTRCF